MTFQMYNNTCDRHYFKNVNRSEPSVNVARESAENTEKGLKQAHSVYFCGFRGKKH